MHKQPKTKAKPSMHAQTPKPQSPEPQAQLLSLIKNAQKLARLSVYLGWVAIGSFVVFGTISTLKAAQGNALIYMAFHYLPYVLIGLSIPISLYHLFLLWRYQLVQSTILMTILCLSVGLFSVSTFMAMVAWFAMPYLFRVSLQKFLDFLSHSAKPEA